jgi:hypothetical protein
MALYVSFWVIFRRLYFIRRRFGTLSDGTVRVFPKCRHIEFRRRGITHKKPISYSKRRMFETKNRSDVLNKTEQSSWIFSCVFILM